MPDLPAITVENLGKRYTIGHERRPDTLRDSLTQGARGLWRRWFAGQRSAEREDFWALQDVSFEVPRGEVVGIIGRNGAGKSTLLKILSRITEPTTGRAVIRGRVASLLEVGTGFHPELTGRENIFLNGAILGMTRAEIARKFDEIVAFAEVERFLDTPVKHYSSGMYVRLAFAVAAHLEPEILIVDEVLAVGDQRFQEKCLGKMRSVTANEGRTVVFVSHNMSTMVELCSQALLLETGRITRTGAPREVVGAYLSSGGQNDFNRTTPPAGRAAIMAATIHPAVSAGRPAFQLEVRVHCRESLRCALEFKLHDAVGRSVAFASLGGMIPDELLALPTGDTLVKCIIEVGDLAAGRYGATLKLAVPFTETLDEVAHCLGFDHAPPVPSGHTHVLQQAWGAGYFTLPARRLS